jgi:type II secretory pathway component GspD/PulD (secretin)
VLNIREAETQIMIKSGNTAVIGGLQSERDEKYVQKIPILGDIPFLGRLFQRHTDTKKKTDLLIFLKATVVDSDKYASDSLDKKQTREAGMRLDSKDTSNMENIAVPLPGKAAPASTDKARQVRSDKETSTSNTVDNAEILHLVRNINAPTNKVESK